MLICIAPEVNKMKGYYWKGWETLTANGLHVNASKQHLTCDNKTTLCGKEIPVSFSGISSNYGEGDCRKCRKVAEQHKDDIEILN